LKGKQHEQQQNNIGHIAFRHCASCGDGMLVLLALPVADISAGVVRPLLAAAGVERRRDRCLCSGVARWMDVAPIVHPQIRKRW